MTATAEDWSDLEGKAAEVRDTNTMPRMGTARTPSGTRRVSGRLTKKLEILQAQLSGQMFQAGTMIGLGLPVTGYYIAQESGNFTSAIVSLARKRTEWIDALEHLADIAPGITIGRTVLGIGAAMGTDRFHKSEGTSGFDPDKRACMFLGVTAAYYEIYGKGDGNVPSSGVFTPAPSQQYTPVT